MITKPIHVFTGRSVVCTSSTRFGCSAELNRLVSSFFFAECTDKERMLKEYFNADYVFVQKRLDVGDRAIEFPVQDCNFIEKVFEGNNVIVYRILTETILPKNMSRGEQLYVT